MRTRVGRKTSWPIWTFCGTRNQREDVDGLEWREETILPGKGEWGHCEQRELEIELIHIVLDEWQPRGRVEGSCPAPSCTTRLPGGRGAALVTQRKHAEEKCLDPQAWEVVSLRVCPRNSLGWLSTWPRFQVEGHKEMHAF